MTMQHMLTTIDNPFDPFENFDGWDTWDRRAGYCSSAYLARVVVTSDDLSEADQLSDIERAIDEIVLFDPLNIYIKVSKDVKLQDKGNDSSRNAVSMADSPSSTV